MEINIPALPAEITDAFGRYTRAPTANDIDTVIAGLWPSEYTLRYSTGENLYRIDAIAAFRNTPRRELLISTSGAC